MLLESLITAQRAQGGMAELQAQPDKMDDQSSKFMFSSYQNYDPEQEKLKICWDLFSDLTLQMYFLVSLSLEWKTIMLIFRWGVSNLFIS